MNTTNKLVTVIVPFYNAEKFLEEAILSVFNQTWTNWELILVDDGSTDSSKAIAEKYVDEVKVFLFQHAGGENLGVSRSRKVAINAARGELIAFLDADDLFTDDKLEKNIAQLERHPSAILIHSAAHFIKEGSAANDFYNDFSFPLADQPYSFLDTDFLNRNPICNSSVLVKSEYLKKIQNSFNHLFQFEDWATWILLAQHGKFLYTNEQLCSYRFHEKSSTSFLLRNNLTGMYARLEMLFIVWHRIEINLARQNIDAAIKKQLGEICSAYALLPGSTDGDSLFIEKSTAGKNSNALRKGLSFLKSKIQKP